MKITDTGDLWWKTAVLYCLDVETFMDWNDDGVGDFEGLTNRIDYLAELGITCLWLMPFYPSPDRDDGYDITDFTGVDPRLGSLGDIAELVRVAKDRGIRVIVDLVVNHTSDQHPWFKAARSSVDSPFRDFYVWRDRPPRKNANTVFPGEEASMWELDDRSGQYYLHSFYAHQPDLNVVNSRVRDEIAKIIGFWLALGVSGFRIDAVPFLLEIPEGAEFGDPHEWLRDLRRFMQRRSSEAIILGEVNLPHADQVQYFGGQDASELTMQFDFVSMQHTYLSLVRGDARSLAASLADRPQLPPESQWANFLRNHDELTLDKLTDAERQEVFDALAPDPAQRVYDRGIVRRLPPMLEGDPRRIRMAYSLMFSLPGTPVLFYGEEIGMGENPDLPARQAVRSPMQWRGAPGAGFSDAPARRLVAKPPTGGYAPEHVNVTDQRRDQGSLLSFMSRLIAAYRSSPELGWGALELLDSGVDAVLAHAVGADTGRIVCLHNLGTEATEVTLAVPGAAAPDRLVHLIADGGSESSVALDDRGRATIDLEPFGFAWLRVVREGDKRLT